MSEDNGWKWQLSLKLGGKDGHLVNIRAENWEEFAKVIQIAQENARNIWDAIKAFEPVAPVLIPTPAQYPVADVRATPPAAPVAAPAQGQEVGPVTIEKIDQSSGVGQNGKPYTRFMVQFSGNLKASTFDTLTAGAAKSLLGKLAYATLTKWEKGYNLESVRSA
jgi:hypothetical protein